MLFPKRLWDALADGSVTVAFRYWKRPTVKAGGSLVTPAGVLGIDGVDRIGLRRITAADARAAGYDTRAALVADLARYRRPGTALYRIAFHYAGEDPRRALREDDRVGGRELLAIRERLARLDRSSRQGPWTRSVLPTWLDPQDTLSHRETPHFKADVRKLKTLGLTESLRVGYRLSPRGRAVLRRLPCDS